MSHPAPDHNNAKTSEDDFARVRIVAVDDGTHLMQVSTSLEPLVDPRVSLHVFMSQSDLNTFLKDADSREVIIHLETVEDLDEPTLEIDRNERIHLRAAKDAPEVLASDILVTLKRSFRAVLRTLKSLREAASPTPPPARARTTGPVSCADC